MKTIILRLLLLLILSLTLTSYNLAANLGSGIQSRIEILESRINQASDTTRARNLKVKLDRVETKVNSSSISYQDEKQWQDFRDDIQRELTALEEDVENLR